MSKATNTVTRQIGNCQICEGDFKVQRGMIVLHGYERPGWGHVVGRCGGEHQQPYETSCEAIKPWLAGVVAQLADRRAYLARLQAGEVAHFSVWFAPSRWARAEPEERQYVLCVTEPLEWNQALRLHTANVEDDVRALARDVARLTRRIADWQPRPLREVDERGRTAEDRAASDARAKGRADARAAKQAKADALKAKRDERAATRKAMLDEAGAKIRAAADSGKPRDEARHEALTVLCDLGRRKNRSLLENAGLGSYWWETDLGADEALVRLGLAMPDPRLPGRIEYMDRLWRA